MDTLLNLMDVLKDGRLFMSKPTPTHVQLTHSNPDINIVDIVASGNHVHAFGTTSSEQPTIQYFRPQQDMTPWLYVKKHFNLTTRDMVPSEIGKQLKTHPMKNTRFYLRVMAILATHVQDTPHIQHLAFQSTPNISQQLEITTNRWFRPGEHNFPIYHGGQALTHVLMGNTKPASEVHVWVQTQTDMEVVIKTWRQRHGSTLILGTRPGGTVVACLPRTPCSCTVQVVPAHETYHALWKLQPDLTQCSFDGNTVTATPRCRLALETHTSHHPHNSKRAWVGPDSGLHTQQLNAGGKPVTMDNEDPTKAAWDMITQFGCTGVSMNPCTDSMLFTNNTKDYTLNLREFLENPLQDGVTVKIQTERMHVVGRQADNVLVVQNTDLSRIVTRLKQTYPYKYTTDIHVLVENVRHAGNGEPLKAVPFNTSVGGAVTFTFLIGESNIMFYLKNALVYPSHKKNAKSYEEVRTRPDQVLL